MYILRAQLHAPVTLCSFANSSFGPDSWLLANVGMQQLHMIHEQ